jgi:hypothetical protein
MNLWNTSDKNLRNTNSIKNTNFNKTVFLEARTTLNRTVSFLTSQTLSNSLTTLKS